MKSLQKRRACCTFIQVPRKMLLAMRISVVLLFGVFLQVSAAGWAQKVDMKETKTTYRELFQEVERQTGLITILSNDEMDINQEVNVQEGTFELKELYQQVLTDAGMEFRLVDGYIVIKPAQKTIFIEEVTQQESKTVLQGFIVDAETNQPLLGVNVAIKGTAQGTITDESGAFRLDIEEQSGTLAFSYIGYEDQERPFSESSSFAIVMVPAVSSVDEVIVYATGLTKISKERATGSYSVMTRADIESSPNEEIARSLEGNVTGLQESYNPQTGQNEITIRGVGTINSERAPLIVVDGFPVEGDFSTINPNDIDNVTVLKDAAAASIWGARAGNGVIVITTRKGKNSGKFNVELGSYLKMGEELDMDYNLARASIDNQLAYEKYLVDNNYGSFWGVPDNLADGRDVYSKGVQAYWDHQRGVISASDLNATIARLKATDYTDDVKKYLLRKPVTQQHNVSISGSTDRASYYLSVLYNDVKGHYQESRDQKVLINFRNTYQLKDWLGLRFGITSEIKKANDSGSNLSTIRGISPYENLVNADGTYAQVDHGLNFNYMNPIAKTADGLPYNNWAYNPIEEMLNRDLITNYNNSRIQTGLDFKIMDGLHFSPSFQYERFTSETKNYNGEDTYYVRNMANDNVKYDENTNTVSEAYMPKGGVLNQRNSETVTYDLRNQINFDRKFSTDHEVNLVVATEHIWKQTEGHGNMLYGYNPDSHTHAHPAYGYGSSAFNWNTLIPSYYGGGLSTGHFLSYSNTRLFSFFANAAYTYRQKYTITGSYRTDASNMIVDDPKFRYSPFWSIGGSWNAKRESFLNDVDILDQLTVRATYGISGNTVTTASTVPVISLSAEPSNRTGERSGRVSDYGNPTLRWERINQLNVAVDFSMFNRMLYGSFEVYDKQSEDLLASVAVAPTYGSTQQTFNVAEVSNKGFEMSLNGNLKFGGLTWNPGLNYSYNTSKVLSLQVSHIYPRTISTYRFVEGQPVAPAYSWVYGGMNEDNLPTIIGENGVTYTMNENIGSNGEEGQDVLRNMGTFIAPTVIGFSNTFQFKDFTFRALITGKFGHVFRRPTFSYSMLSRTKEFYHEDLNGLVEGKANEMGIPALPVGYEFNSYRWGWYAPDLNTLVEDASHIRVRELYLGYKLPERIAASIGLDKLTVFAHARDLGTIWTANDKGIDPEYIKGSRFNPGASYTIGFNLGF
ncbi:SusC/RagA family TonB-linked outer membrane protein [Carboxylicivirga mesophila]|uniref:SusC/RagA family TonB-linked outer membrane protein n=1 Tax=Carboxylicivirga mesophila TaxID=1166478 RepID=A0ABS5KC85_9BACT|nr:SusC/RagA family TonB-linked outer membrane protein [Carboxylicivirga mesophila]MBS2212645.1 SusC/RagA family TonB-linked outer membrane protein [Carboxylicivirga mesophila]